MNKNWLWDVELTESRAKKILKDTKHKDFFVVVSLLLSRNNQAKDIFKEYLDPLIFCNYWARIKKRMRQDRWNTSRINFWQTIFDKLKDRYHSRGIILRKTEKISRDKLCRDVGDKIRSLRQEKNFSQKEFADKLGISQQLISRIEKGQENVSLVTLKNLVRALGRKVSINFLKTSYKDQDVLISQIGDRLHR
ncbi:MAG: helix-turn-helix transcriptional regulator [Candidatus Omnitrophota bacterium]|nr:helix-turn-helix domain-containing protein [Candidatus Omnitrophota bacterium]